MSPPALSALRLCRLPKAQTHAASVFVDEVDASRLKGASYDVQSSAPWLTCFVLKLVDSDRPDARAVGKYLLSPAEEASGSSALGGRDAHRQEIAEAQKIYNSAVDSR
jgi:hypothetical protein